MNYSPFNQQLTYYSTELTKQKGLTIQILHKRKHPLLHGIEKGERTKEPPGEH